MPTYQKHHSIDLLRVSTAGSVDDGKSTLIGRMLYDAGLVPKDQLEAIKKASEKRGLKEVDLSLLLDGLSAEREQGITIDVAYRYFSTRKRKFVVADVPGHEQYTRNMVTGASTANLALILIDARKGVLQQTRRHLFIASLLGIPHIAVVINKMDLVSYDEKVYNNIVHELSDFAAKLQLREMRVIPVSALKGDMIVNRGENMPWYQDSTLLGYLENMQITSDENLIDFRFPVQYVVRPNQDFRGYAGKVEGGVIRTGHKVTILPSGKTTEIESIYVAGKEVDHAFCPQSAMVTFKDEIDASRGDMIVREKNLPELESEFEAMVCWMNEKPMEMGRRYLLKHGSKSTGCTIDALRYSINVDTLWQEQKDTLNLNDIGRAYITTHESIAFDRYAQNRNTGGFILIDEETNETAAAGLIVRRKKTSVAQEIQKKEGKEICVVPGMSAKEVEELLGDLESLKIIDGEGLSKEDLREKLIQSLGVTAK